MDKNYLIPAVEFRREYTQLNSKFIGIIAPVFGSDEARAFTKKIRLEFPDASHHVTAYIIGGGSSVTEYCSDDGEPQGTAGRPALTVLRGSGLGDCVVVITRYFGGTLLGTGGLVKAYTETAQLVVRDVPRSKIMQVQTALLGIQYNLLERVRLMVSRYKGVVLGEDFGADILMTLRFPADSYPAFQTELQELSSGTLQAESLEISEMLVPV